MLRDLLSGGGPKGKSSNARRPFRLRLSEAKKGKSSNARRPNGKVKQRSTAEWESQPSVDSL